MAHSATAIYNIDANGTATGGCFYKSDAGTTDYSQQNSPQWTSTNVSSDAAGTQITDDDAQGTVTAQMVGNGVYITGGDGFTTGWYEVASFIDGDNFTIDRSAGASKSGGTANIGGSLSVFLDLLDVGMTAGYKVMIKNGSYSLTENILWIAGNSTNRVQILGYNTSYSDLATGDNRPNITFGAFEFNLLSYYIVSGLRGTFTGGYALRGTSSAYPKVTNCSFEKLTASGSTAAIQTTNDSIVVGCDVTISAGSITSGILINQSTGITMGNYVLNDGGTVTHGINAYTNLFNIVSGCSSGIFTRTNGYANNNTIYDCTVGLTLTNTGCDAINNDINSCTTGISGTVGKDNRLDWNNYHNNTADVSNCTKGEDATATDPNYTDAANGDFTNDLDPANAMPLGFADSIKQGAVQDAGGGAGGGETAVGYFG